MHQFNQQTNGQQQHSQQPAAMQQQMQPAMNTQQQPSMHYPVQQQQAIMQQPTMPQQQQQFGGQPAQLMQQSASFSQQQLNNMPLQQQQQQQYSMQNGIPPQQMQAMQGSHGGMMAPPPTAGYAQQPSDQAMQIPNQGQLPMGYDATGQMVNQMTPQGMGINQQGPPQTAPLLLRPGPFKTTLFACFGHCAVCFMGCCCPCCLYGDNYSRLHGQGFMMHCLLYGCCPLLTCIFAADLRRSIRTKYKLHEEPCSDCCVHCWCSPCAVCQEARELNLRG